MLNDFGLIKCLESKKNEKLVNIWFTYISFCVNLFLGHVVCCNCSAQFLVVFVKLFAHARIHHCFKKSNSPRLITICIGQFADFIQELVFNFSRTVDNLLHFLYMLLKINIKNVTNELWLIMLAQILNGLLNQSLHLLMPLPHFKPINNKHFITINFFGPLT